MSKISAKYVVVFLYGFALVSAAIQWDCPPSTFQEEKGCHRQMGLSIDSSPVYDVDQMIQNCRTRQGGELLTCFQDSRRSCNITDTIREIIDPSLVELLEPSLDYVCSFTDLISRNKECLATLDRSRKPRHCIQDPAKEMAEEFQDYPDLTVNNLRSGLCGYNTAVSDCQYRVTREACGDELGVVLGNFWFSANAEWCF